jgi:hypothetical protein
MSNFRPPNTARVVVVGVCLSRAERARLIDIARRHGVTISTFMRAILVDALAEEVEDAGAVRATPDRELRCL